MAKMNGCNSTHDNMKKSQGTMRVTPGTFARNNLAKGGVNSDLGGGATSGVKMQLKAGKASADSK